MKTESEVKNRRHTHYHVPETEVKREMLRCGKAQLAGAETIALPSINGRSFVAAGKGNRPHFNLAAAERMRAMTDDALRTWTKSSHDSPEAPKDAPHIAREMIGAPVPADYLEDIAPSQFSLIRPVQRTQPHRH